MHIFTIVLNQSVRYCQDGLEMALRLTIQHTAFDGLNVVFRQAKLAVLHMRGSQSLPCAQAFPAVCTGSISSQYHKMGYMTSDCTLIFDQRILSFCHFFICMSEVHAGMANAIETEHLPVRRSPEVTCHADYLYETRDKKFF